MKSWTVVAFGVIALTARLAAAQGTITGTVTASADASPVVGATVTAYDTNRSIILSVVTDSSGVYTFSDFTPGTYYLRFNRDGFVPVAFDSIPCAAQSCVSNGALALGLTPTPVTLIASATTTINVALDRGSTISGTVIRSDDHTPVSGLQIHLYDASTSPVATVRTASNGTYSFTGIPFGTYFARTDRSGANLTMLDVLYGGTICLGGSTPRCRIDSGTAIVVSGSAPTATANFSLPRGGTILGSLSNGNPGSGSSFFKYPMALYQGTTFVAASTADTGGGFGFGGLDPGTYFVRTNTGNGSDVWYSTSLIAQSLSNGACVACPGVHPSPVTVSVDTVTGGINLLIVPSLGSGIAGTLTLHGASTVSNGMTPSVQIYNTDGTLVQTWTGVLAPSGGNETVQWSVLVPPGTYYVRTSSFSQPVFFDGFTTLRASGLWVDDLYDNKTCVAADCDPRLGTPVTVTQGAVTSGINFALDMGGQISGTLDAGFNGGTTQVEVYDSRGVRLPQRSGAQAGDFTSHGYASVGLPSGTYYLVAASLPVGVPRVLFDGNPCNACAVTSGTPVTVGLGEQKTGVNFPIVAERKISGTVLSDSTAIPPNQPLSTIDVEAYGPDGQLSSSTTTTADGTYTIGHLGPGTYTLRTHNARGFVDHAYGTAVVVSGIDLSGIDFALLQGQTISGQVAAADGGSLASARVLVYTASPSSATAHVSADAGGFYLANVPAGSYFVQTDSVAGHTQLIYNGIACPQGTCPTGSAAQVPVASTPVSGINFNLPACQALAIAPVSLANAAVGIAYRQTLVTTPAGSARFVISFGGPPPGLTLDSTTGVLSGTPTTAGHFTFTVSAIDSTGCAGSRTYSLDVPACTYADSGPLGPLFLAPTPLRFPPTFMFGNAECAAVPQPTSDAPWLAASLLTLPATDAGPSALLLQVFVSSNQSAFSRTGHLTVGPRVIPVTQAGVAPAAPFGSVDAPVDGAVVSGSIAISGWALGDFVVSRVLVYRDPVDGEPAQLIFVGQSTFVPGARPDVAAIFPTLPQNTRAGWGYLLLTNMLPNQGNGTFRFSVFAENAFDGSHTLIGTKVINAVNSSATAPFGAIDTPDQGATVSGSALVNFGWALTPQPKMISFDGSTIHVLIDGFDVGPVTAYNFFRSDVSGLFTGLKNSGGPVGYRMIDTTALSEGLHTIAWLATDDAGKTTGIGSRYFTVNNSAWQPSLRANFAAVPPALNGSDLAQPDAGQGVSAGRSTAIPARVDGVDLGRKAASLTSLPVDSAGALTVQMANLQSLELSLVRQDASADACSTSYAGYLVVDGELHPMPVGSSLDPGGTFYWHPGPGFFGTYHLLFVRTGCQGAEQRIPVTVHIS